MTTRKQTDEESSAVLMKALSHNIKNLASAVGVPPDHIVSLDVDTTDAMLAEAEINLESAGKWLDAM